MEIPQLRLARLIFGEFYQVAALEEFPETLFLIAREQVRSLQFIQELFRRPLRRVKVEPLLEIPTDGIGHQNAEFTRLTKQGQRFLEFLFGADVWRNRRDNRRLSATLLPEPPHRPQHRRNRQRAEGPPDPSPAAGDLERRLDVPQAIGA